ncbi:protein DDI1 homolog 2 isoform X2 [Candoia aspera]|uniref:protein DDI1 homolog 2 isoform X2 n=1 Tax=Candoia aspera TaxID=51853 RepID=UPI002FD7EE8E
MLLTVFCLRRDRSELTFSLQVDADFELQNFRALCELESGIPAAESQIVFAERPLTDNHRSLASYGLKDGDVVILQQVENAQAQPPAPFPEKFTQVLVGQQQDRARREQERIRLFSADPFDLEAQAKIEEDIRQQNIEENMTIAMEEAPESFGQVVMLYINCKVNGHPVKAFVDSGAQMTIMSQACAERCNIMRLVDRRWAGIARGVGTQKIIGRVHLAQVQIEGDFLPCSFSILEEQPMDMLLGLDMLKRHQCAIDLKKNVLVIGTTGSQTAFLPEGELPECAKLAYGAGREDMRPDELADQELAEALQKSAEEAENCDTETTSLGAPSQPASDGFEHPVCFPERGLKTHGSLASRLLDHSVSAPSACSPQSGRAEPVNPRAEGSPDCLLEPSGPLRNGRLLASPPNLAGTGAASAEVPAASSPIGGSAPPQNTRAKTAASGCLQEEDAPGMEPQEAGAESSPCDAPWETNASDAPLLLEPAERNKAPEMGGTPRKEPPPGEQGEPVCGEDIFSPPVEEEQRFRDREEGGASRVAEGKPEGALAPLLGGDPSLEGPSAPEPSDPHILGSAGGGAQDTGMELELYRPHGLPLPLGLLPASSLTPPGNAGYPSRSRDQDKDQGVSLASALKELHRLLVESAQHDFRVARQEESCSPVAPPEDLSPAEEMSLERPGLALSHPVHPGMEAAASARTGMPQEHRLAGGLEQEAPGAIQGASGRTHAVPASPLAALPPQQGEEHLETMARHLSSGELPGCTASRQSPLPSHALGPDPRAAQGIAGRPPEERRASEAAAEKRPEDQPEPSVPPQGSFPGAPAHPSALSSAANLDQIVGAGFTPQEAGEALEHAGGNADLALLILLARNIVVPT